MKKIIIFTGLFISFLWCSGQPADSLLNGTEKVNDWERTGKPENYQGDELYDLINGGADLFLEYGFENVSLVNYKNKDKAGVRMELYKMEDNDAAFGIFSSQVPGNARDTNIGHNAVYNDRYILFWKDDYYCSIASNDTGEAVIRGMFAIAGAIDKKIKNKGQKPDILNLIPFNTSKNKETAYLEGGISLYNSKFFTPKNIFKIQEAVVLKAADFKFCIFRYDDAATAKTRYTEAIEAFQKDEKFHDIRDNNYMFYMQNDEFEPIAGKATGRYIIISWKLPPEKALILISETESKIR
mgnify:CR=1 FL=1